MSQICSVVRGSPGDSAPALSPRGASGEVPRCGIRGTRQASCAAARTGTQAHTRRGASSHPLGLSEGFLDSSSARVLVRAARADGEHRSRPRHAVCRPAAPRGCSLLMEVRPGLLPPGAPCRSGDAQDLSACSTQPMVQAKDGPLTQGSQRRAEQAASFREDAPWSSIGARCASAPLRGHGRPEHAYCPPGQRVILCGSRLGFRGKNCRSAHVSCG
jgi:hypothetical protein